MYDVMAVAGAVWSYPHAWKGPALVTLGRKINENKWLGEQIGAVERGFVTARRRNIECYRCGKKGHISRYCRSNPQVIRGMVEQESSAPAEEAHIDEVNSEDFTSAQQ